MGKVNEVFPMIVYQGDIDCHNEFNEKYLEDIKKYWFNGYKYESPEGSANIFLHLNENYCDFFISLRKVFDEYFDTLNIEYEKLNYHICKSWVVYHKDDTAPPLAPHKHNEANISFVYYVNTDKTSDKFVVSQIPDTNKNQVCRGFFDVADERNLMRGFNKYNCNMYTITPKEGTCIVFPSETYHHTIKNVARESERVAISGDVRVTLKPDHFRHHQGCTHPSQWLEI